jgi:hypothetical protein
VQEVQEVQVKKCDSQSGAIMRQMQKVVPFSQKAVGFADKPPGFGQKAVGFVEKAAGYVCSTPWNKHKGC